MSSLRATVEDYISVWRLIDFGDLQEILIRSRGIHPNQFYDLMCRLRKSKKIIPFKKNSFHLIFDPKWENRHKYLQLGDQSKIKTLLSRSGMSHHVGISKIGIQLRILIQDCEVRPVFNIDRSLASGGAGSIETNYSPDIVLSLTDKRDLFYLEFERSMKAKGRYTDRWIDYESNPLVKSCLYFVDRIEVQNRLRLLICDYFKNCSDGSDFCIGLVPVNGRVISKRFEIFGGKAKKHLELIDYFESHRRGDFSL